MREKIREILKELKNSDGEILFGVNGYYSCQEAKIDRALIDITILLSQAIPEEKDDKEKDSLKKYFGDIRYDEGYNQAIKEIKQRLGIKD